MSGRGRGGRGGRGGHSKSFNREQLQSLGITGTEVVPGPVTQPPPLYPLLDRKPVPLTHSQELDYLLLLRQDFIDQLQTSNAYLKLPKKTDNKPKDELEKLIAQLPHSRGNYDWHMLPSELRPKVIARRSMLPKILIKKEIDINKRFEKLEALENNTIMVSVKEEPEEVIEDEEQQEGDYEDGDEEMDDDTDYANNYFDNGEAYEDEDDNLDDGPIY